MRTITKTMLNRLQAQAEEAKMLGLTKIASSLSEQVEKHSDHVRDTEELYVYSGEQMREDVEKALWTAIVRVADFYGANFDAEKAQVSVDKIASDLVDEVRINVGATDGVGAYEASVPGEVRERVVIDLVENN